MGSNRISNPGCYPTGFIALTRPLVDAKLVRNDAMLAVSAVSGYRCVSLQICNIAYHNHRYYH